MWNLRNRDIAKHASKMHSHCLGAAFQAVALQTLNAPRLAEPTFPVHIYDLDLYHPPRISLGHQDWFYVSIGVDGRVLTTAVSGKCTLPWKDNFKINVRQSSVITLRIFAKRMLHEDTYIGYVQCRMDACVSSNNEAGRLMVHDCHNIIRDLERPLPSNHRDNIVPKTKLSFSIKRIQEPSEHHLKTAAEAERPEKGGSQSTAKQEHIPSPKCPEKNEGGSNAEHGQRKPLERALIMPTLAAIIPLFPDMDQIQQILDNANAFSPLLEKINIFLELTQTIGHIHPYVKMAAVVLVGVIKVCNLPSSQYIVDKPYFQVYKSQVFFENSIKDLVEAMADAHGFLSEANALDKIQSHQAVINELTEHTKECGKFMRDTLSSKSLARLGANVLVDRKVQKYVQKFRDLKATLNERALVSAAVNILHVRDEVKVLRDEVHRLCKFPLSQQWKCIDPEDWTARRMSLDAMGYAEHTHYTSIEEYDTLRPDQLQRVEEITGWIASDTEARVYYMCGPAGCGKTFVARMVAHRFHGLEALGSSYFVHEPAHHATSHNSPCLPANLFRTIARDIADHDSQFMQAVLEVVEKRSIRVTYDTRTQFEELILYPARMMGRERGPVVIVIDGLDNCGDRESRRTLLAMLASKTRELPPTFRILITSRPESDIVQAFNDNLGHVVVKTCDGEAGSPDTDPVTLQNATTSSGSLHGNPPM
ncbi:hypothetical protein ID866_9206 [Astraeus odoratus]|nr:hypothetical protein ID866_9206 [Astraeus odoratus]